MVDKVIRNYIEGGAKKLTVPGFGTFMRRESASEGSRAGDVIFVDLLRTDDGVLSELVEDTGHYSEVEAMALIDRFIFETRAAIERTGSAAIEGFGTMTLDHKGVYQFKYAPKARPVAERAVQEQLFKGGGEVSGYSSVGNDGNENREFSSHQGLKSSESTAKSPVSPSRPAKVGASGKRPGSPSVRPASSRRTPQKPKMSRTDTIVVVAIVAAAIALIAMLFGLTAGGTMPFLQK